MTHQKGRPIVHVPGVCGGDATIQNTRIMVWLLVSLRELGMSDEELLDSYPTIDPDDLVNALAYAAAHPEEIARNIAENEFDEDGLLPEEKQ